MTNSSEASRSLRDYPPPLPPLNPERAELLHRCGGRYVTEMEHLPWRNGPSTEELRRAYEEKLHADILAGNPGIAGYQAEALSKIVVEMDWYREREKFFPEAPPPEDRN